MFRDSYDNSQYGRDGWHFSSNDARSLVTHGRQGDETPPPTPPEKYFKDDQFTGLYILMDAAVAVRQREQSQSLQAQRV